MNRSLLLIAAATLAGCSQSDITPTAAVPAGPAFTSALVAGDDRGIVASVTGHAENTFYGGELLRNVSFSARQHADGRVEGNFEVVLQGPGRFSGYPDEGTQPIHFQVTCLEVEGKRAWIGGRIVAPKNDPYLGGEDVWYVEDGGETGPDRVAVYIGAPARRCVEKFPTLGSPSERGELTVRDED
jgi:hypothetical protein